MRLCERAEILVYIVFAAITTGWFYYLFDPALGLAHSRWTMFCIRLGPVVAAVLLIFTPGRMRFAPVVIVCLAMIVAQRAAIHSLSPDISFHIGKTMWASRGQPLLDPVIGGISPYPAAFHFLWGVLVKLTGTHAQSLLRSCSIFNLVGLWLVVSILIKKLLSREDATTALFVMSLALFTKDISEVLFASPGSFSMPFAVLGWYLCTQPTNLRRTWFGALSLGGSILIWPTHLFGAAGVAVVEGWQGKGSLKGWVYAGAAALAVISMRSAVHGGESRPGLQLRPSNVGPFALGRFEALVTLGTHYYGWVPGR